MFLFKRFAKLAFFGIPVFTNSVDEVAPGSALASQLQEDDRILKVNDMIVPVTLANPERMEAYTSEATHLHILLLRDGTLVEKYIDKHSGESLGIKLDTDGAPISFYQAMQGATTMCRHAAENIVDSARNLVNASSGIKMSEALAEPIGAVSFIKEAGEESGVWGLAVIFVILSINIGVFNLLPLPVLDGEHVFFEKGFRTAKEQYREITSSRHCSLNCYPSRGQ